MKLMGGKTVSNTHNEPGLLKEFTMHEEAPILHGSKRDKIGTRYAQRDRASGKLPGVIYGHKLDPVAITLDAKDTLSHIKKGEKVFQIAVDEAKPETVLLKDLQFGHLGDNIIHADFARVDLTERVQTRVHLTFIGEAKGLKRSGAVLVKQLNDIELDVQVSNIVEAIEVDISGLDVGESIKARDVQLPVPTMKLLTDPEAIVVQIETAAEEVADEASDTDAAASPEVLTERKSEED